ncbi:hypothetical protein QJQ45_021666, partial [Haematococcus lacustris]
PHANGQPHRQQPQSLDPALPERSEAQAHAKPTQPIKSKGKAKSNSTKPTLPAPQPGRWVDGDCTAALDMQCIVEINWRKATARRTAHRVMTKKKRKGSDKKRKVSRSAQGKQRQDRRDGWTTRRRQPAPAQPASMECDTDSDSESDCGSEPEPQSDSESESESEAEPVTQPPQRRCSARLAALAPAAPTGPPLPLDCEDPLMLRQLKDFCMFFANPNFKTCYNQLQRRHVRNRHPMLMPAFEDPSNQALVAKLQELGSIYLAERIVKLYAKAARAKLGWSGEEAQLFIRMACGYGINAHSSELKAATLDKGHVADLIEEANKHRRLLGMKKEGSLQDTLPLPCRMRHAVHRSKRTKAEPGAAEPTKGKGKAARAKPAPQPGRWLDRDCNAALNMQRIGESRWRPLELCYWPDQGALPAKGKEYLGLGYKRLVGVHFIKVDSRVLHGVCKQLGLTKETRAAFTSEPALSHHWARWFNTNKLRNKGFRFERLVDTDGVSVCVHYTRPLPPPPAPPPPAASSSSTSSRPSAAAAAAHAVGLPHIGRGIAEVREFVFDPDTQIGVGIDPGVTQAVSAASGVWDPATGQLKADQLRRWKLTKGQVKHDSGLNNARRDTERWLAPIKPHLQHLAAASSAGTSLEANLKHITVTLTTWDAVWEVYLDPKWARQRLRLYGAQDRALEQFFNKLEEQMAELSMKRHGCAKQLVVFFGAATIGTGGGWGADAVLRACRKVVCRPRGKDQDGGRVVLVDEHRTSRVSSAVNGKQPCEVELNTLSATRPAGWKPPAGQVEERLVRPAWSQERGQPVRGLVWCPVVAPHRPPQAPRSGQAATQPAASEPGPSTPQPAKRSKRTKAEPGAAEPTKGKGKGKAAKAKPAPQPGRWLDRDCNAALNMQRIGESRWRPLELCYWPDQGALPAKGKEYPGLGYKRLRDKPPKAQEQQQQPAEAQQGKHGVAMSSARQPAARVESNGQEQEGGGQGRGQQRGPSQEGENDQDRAQPGDHSQVAAAVVECKQAPVSLHPERLVGLCKGGVGIKPEAGGEKAVRALLPSAKLLEKATARRTAHRVMAKKKRKGSDKKRKVSRSAQGKQRQDRRDGWTTRRRQVIKVPEGAVLRGCKKTRRKLKEHLRLRAEVHSQLRVIASLFVLRIFLTCLVGYPTPGCASAPQPPAVQPPQPPDAPPLPPLPPRAPAQPAQPAQPASMECDTDSDSESDCGSEPEPQSDSESESESEAEPVTQPPQRRCSARLAALAPAAPTGPPLPLDCEDPVMLRQLKDFCMFFANPNFKTCYNQLQRRHVRNRHPMLMPAFEDPSNQALVAKLQELGSIYLAGDANTIDAHSMQLAVAMQQHYSNPGKSRAVAAAGTSLEANLKHITVTLATWDAVWEVYLDPKWARQRLRLYGAQDRALEQFFNKLEEQMAELSMQRHGCAKQLVVFFGAATIGTGGGWGADAVLRACRKVVCRPRGKDQDGGRVVLVDEHRTSRVSSAVNGKQPCEVELNTLSATRPAGWKPPAGQVEERLVRPAWSQERGQPVRGLVWCPVVAPRRPPQAPRSSQAATQPAASEPGPSTPQPAKRSKRTKAEPGAAEPTKGKGKGKAAKAKPAPQPGRWLDRDCNAALNMQRIGESRWRPLELCYWPDQGALPAKGKEYPGLGYKRLRDKPPKAQEQQQQPAVAHEALRQDVARLQSNNSSLLVQLKQAKEQNEHSDKGNYQTVKSLEDRIAELTFWQQSALSRLESSEKDNYALKAKVVELVKLTDQLTAGITPLSPARKPTGAAVDILQAANARIASLQRQLMERDAQLAALRQQVTSSIDGSQREVAGQRLRAGSGADSDVAALTARNEANESMILQLNSTVESLGQQLRSLEGTAKDKARLEGQLASEQRLRAEADDKLRRAVKDNEGIMHEVTSGVQRRGYYCQCKTLLCALHAEQVLQLRADLAMLQATNSQANAMAAAEVDNALNSVTGLRARLADSRSETQRLAAQLDSLSSERTAAMSQVSSLQRELDGLRGLLADTTARADDLRSQAYTANEELQAALDNLASKDSQLGEVERRMAALAAELDARKRAGDKAELEREAAATRVEELQQRLNSLEAAAGSEHSTNLQLATQLAKVESQLRGTQSSLATLESEGHTLRQQLREVQEQRVRAQGSLAAAEEERSRLVRELQTASAQLAETRQTAEKLMGVRSELEVEAAQARNDASVLAAEQRVLHDRLKDVTAQLAQSQAACSSAQRELSQLQGMPQRLDDTQEQLRSVQGRASSAEAEAVRCKAEARHLTDQLVRAESDMCSVRRMLSSEQEAAAGLRSQLSRTEQELAGAEEQCRALQAERDQLLSQQRSFLADLESLKGALAAEEAAAQQADAGVRSLQSRLAASQKQLAEKEEEVGRVSSLLAQAQAAVDSARSREEEARSSGRELAERARRAEARAAEYEADIGQLRAAREGATSHIRQLEGSLTSLRGELEARRQEVEQLTTLSLRGDATVQEYMSNLKAMSGDLRAAEMRIADLVSELAGCQDALGRAAAESADLRQLVNTLDQERDNLQAELDSHAEQTAEMSSQLQALQAQVRRLATIVCLDHGMAADTTRLLAMAEGRLAHADARATDSEAEVARLRNQLGAAMEQLQAVSSERNSLGEELRAVSEDLEALVKENQVVSNELAATAQQRDAAAAEVRRLTARVNSAEQMVRSKEAEVEDLRRAYESLALDNRRLQSSVGQLEREAANREAALAARGDEAASLAEATRAAQAQINQYVMDLQAFERQVDVLSRQLARCEQELEDTGRQREVLREEIRAAQQVQGPGGAAQGRGSSGRVRLGLERHREELQRQVAGLDSQLAVARARLEDAGAEASSLGQRLALERNRVAELEGLLAGMRAREYKQDLVSKHGGSQLGIMQERNRILEEQVAALQHQVTALQKSRDVQASGSLQDRELARLRTEAQALAAAAAAEDGNGDAQQVTELAARVLELERRCADLQAQLGAAHAASTTGNHSLARENAELRAETQRLLSLSGELEAEARAAQAALAAAAAAGGQGGKGAAEAVGGAGARQLNAAAEEQVTRLQAQLKEEQGRRRQAERDFLELMTSIEEQGEGQPQGSSVDLTRPQVPGGAAKTASQRLTQLQARVEGLEAEKAGLEADVLKTRALMAAMQASAGTLGQWQAGDMVAVHVLLQRELNQAHGDFAKLGNSHRLPTPANGKLSAGSELAWRTDAAAAEWARS